MKGVSGNITGANVSVWIEFTETTINYDASSCGLGFHFGVFRSNGYYRDTAGCAEAQQRTFEKGVYRIDAWFKPLNGSKDSLQESDLLVVGFGSHTSSTSAKPTLFLLTNSTSYPSQFWVSGIAPKA